LREISSAMSLSLMVLVEKRGIDKYLVSDKC
jgi:hypothetical protein